MFTCKASLASGEKWNTISHTLKDASNLHTNGNYAFRKLGHANLNNSYYLNWRVYSLIYIHRVYCTKNEERILNYEHNEISQIDEYWWIQARTNSGKLLHWSTHTHTHTSWQADCTKPITKKTESMPRPDTSDINRHGPVGGLGSVIKQPRGNSMM